MNPTLRFVRRSEIMILPSWDLKMSISVTSAITPQQRLIPLPTYLSKSEH